VSGYDVSIMFRGKVFHFIKVLEKKLHWYEVVDEDGMIYGVDGRTWLLSLMAGSMMGWR